MKPAWTVCAYIRSKSLGSDVYLPMMQLTIIFFGSNPPDKEDVIGAVTKHTRNCVLVFSEVGFTPIPDE